MANHFVSASCQGEVCSVCGQAATHKVGEEIPHDEPFTPLEIDGEIYPVGVCRHNFTAYVCCIHFSAIMGEWVRKNVCKLATEPAPFVPVTNILIDGPPMSFEAAKIALFRYLDMGNYLQLALIELEAMNTTKAIKKAAAEHLRKAAADFESRKAGKR